MSTAVYATCLDASALVKLYIDEPGSKELREFIDAQATWYTTQVCFFEALGVLKRKFKTRNLTQEQYMRASRSLVAHFAARSENLRDIDLTNPVTFRKIENIFKLYPDLDVADAFQILSLKEGLFASLVGDSQTLFVTDDRDLAAAAIAEGLRVNLVSDL